MPAQIFIPQDDKGNGNVQVIDPEQTRSHLAHELDGKPIISSRSGAKIGAVSDLLFDPKTLEIAGIQITQGNLFSRDVKFIPSSSVKVWGKDVILVDDETGIQSGQSGMQQGWVKLSDGIKGRYVVSKDGVRIGQIDDLMVNEQGKIVGYHLSQVFTKGSLEKSRRIPVNATYSLGKDVLIIDTDKI